MKQVLAVSVPIFLDNKNYFTNPLSKTISYYFQFIKKFNSKSSFYRVKSITAVKWGKFVGEKCIDTTLTLIR